MTFKTTSSWRFGIALLLTNALTLAACGDSTGSTTATTEAETSTSAGSSSATDATSTAGENTGGSMTGMSTSGTSTTSPTTTASTSTSTTTDPTGSVEDCPVFETDIIPIFENSCGANDNLCHSRIAYAAAADANCRGWLALENEPLGSIFYDGPMEGQPTGCPDMPLLDRLLTLDAWQCEAFDPLIRYVVPCDADASYITHKIDGGPYCKNGMGEETMPMPPGVVLDPATIDTIKAWIDAGAPTLVNPECNATCEDDTTTGEPTDPVGEPPTASIFHPGDGEERQIDVPIPFIGEAVDAEDGQLGGASLVWESDLEGVIGDGGMFDKALTTLGTHTITLIATDSDDNIGTDTIQIIVVP